MGLLQLAQPGIHRDASLHHDDHPFADRLHLLEDVRGNDDGGILAQIAHQRTHLKDLRGIEAVGGLVKDQDLRLMHDGLGHSQPLLVALRQRAHRVQRPVHQPRPLQRPLEHGRPAGARNPAQIGHVLEVAHHRHVRIKRSVLR